MAEAKLQRRELMAGAREHAESLRRKPFYKAIVRQNARKLTHSEGVLDQKDDVNLPLANKVLHEPIQWPTIDIPKQKRCHVVLIFVRHPGDLSGQFLTQLWRRHARGEWSHYGSAAEPGFVAERTVKLASKPQLPHGVEAFERRVSGRRSSNDETLRVHVEKYFGDEFVEQSQQRVESRLDRDEDSVESDRVLGFEVMGVVGQYSLA